jgi:hypothetical protein
MELGTGNFIGQPNKIYIYLKKLLCQLLFLWEDLNSNIHILFDYLNFEKEFPATHFLKFSIFVKI